jgi:hypothetical protein
LCRVLVLVLSEADGHSLNRGLFFDYEYGYEYEYVFDRGK